MCCWLPIYDFFFFFFSNFLLFHVWGMSKLCLGHTWIKRKKKKILLGTILTLLYPCWSSNRVQHWYYAKNGMSVQHRLQVMDLLASRQGNFGQYRNNAIWKIMPHCLIWCISQERNARSFWGLWAVYHWA